MTNQENSIIFDRDKYMQQLIDDGKFEDAWEGLPEYNEERIEYDVPYRVKWKGYNAIIVAHTGDEHTTTYVWRTSDPEYWNKFATVKTAKEMGWNGK